MRITKDISNYLNPSVSEIAIYFGILAVVATAATGIVYATLTLITK